MSTTPFPSQRSDIRTKPSQSLPLVFFYVIRLLNEEKVLRTELTGYAECCTKTRFRLVPWVW